MPEICAAVSCPEQTCHMWREDTDQTGWANFHDYDWKLFLYEKWQFGYWLNLLVIDVVLVR